MSPKVLILNGPNLNMLGQREVEIYGGETLAEIESACRSRAEGYAMEIDFRQSNGEAELVDWIQDARGKVQGIIINGGAYTHTSIAILDALKMVDVPIIEVHLSNIFQREDFRRKSYISAAAKGLIAGFGGTGYVLALDAMNQLIQPENED
ncbi:MAG: type II 3-dehydroquinate dehydratase [Alphaproteobacteria bacterium]|nr:type II 3-dehydroquinate dehydratase [Alphaproteobacteria bacterium]